MPDPVALDRRTFIAGLLGTVAFAVAGCARDTSPSGTPDRRTASTTPTDQPTARPSATGRPSPTPSAAPSAAPSPDRAAISAKAARMVMVGFRGTTIGVDDPIAHALRAGLGGVILFDRDQATGKARNIASPAQLTALTRRVRDLAAGPVLIAIDQEGGRVARLGPRDGFPATRSQASIGATDDPDVAKATGRSMGKTMRAAGIDLDLAPVVDVDVDPENPAIGALDRSFSADPSIVGAMAAAEIDGLHAEGIRSAIKHFPGLGSATANTDFDRVDVTDTWTRRELEPYRTLVGLALPDLVMVGHILDRHLDEQWPASLSRAVIEGLLRGEVGWSGPVITDDLGAVAITSITSRRASIRGAIDAGNDLLLFANQATFEPDLATGVIDTIVDLVADGHIEESRLDTSLARLAPLYASAP